MITAIIVLGAALLCAIIYIVSLRGKLERAEDRLSAAKQSLVEQRSDFERLNAEAEKRFEALANKSLAANAEMLRRQSTQSLTEVLAPMKENLDSFRQSVTESYSREARERFSLGERVRELIDLNRTIGSETRRLSDALKGNTRLQGDWGEMILDNILERAGFRKGYEYHVQESVTDSEGRRLRPDVVIDYTEGRRIIIDSKVSISDYFEMLNSEDESQREAHAKAHVASVKKHIAELRNKSYQDAGKGGGFDYVLMFIPHEGAFLAAMGFDSTLWETAFDSRVLIISPAHLMSIVKLIEQMWRHDKQNRNALAIAEEAGKMLDKLYSFVGEMEKVEKALDNARQACDDASRKLSGGPGNLISRAERLKSLGAKAKKSLPGRFDNPTYEG